MRGGEREGEEEGEERRRGRRGGGGREGEEEGEGKGEGGGRGGGEEEGVLHLLERYTHSLFASKKYGTKCIMQYFPWKFTNDYCFKEDNADGQF